MSGPTDLLTHFEDISRNDGRCIIKLAFFSERADASWIQRKWSRFGAWLTGQFVDPQHTRYYTHVELRLSTGHTTSITQDHGRVYMVDNKLLSREGYSCFFQTTVTREQQRKLRLLALEYVENEVPFNLWGMLCNFTPGGCAVDRRGSSVFCSEYIVRLLHAIDMCPELEAHQTSPSDLYRMVSNDPAWKPGYNRELHVSRALGTRGVLVE